MESRKGTFVRALVAAVVLAAAGGAALAQAPPVKIGLLATFAPTLASMPPEFPRSVEVVPKLAAGALAALDRGERAEHDRLVAEASRELRGCDLIALAQYSMAPAAALVAEASGRPVLTTPDSAVLKLKELLAVVG